ncbi:MAG TPA: hypothetical protein VG453_02245 [Nitrospira sp.]|jgi:hypothetical protein|nr:hypothetical protein [Nitrospira sp.]
MKRVGWSMAAICLVVIGMIGCRGGGQVYQVKDAPVQTASGKALTMDEVRKEIIAAGVAAGWQMTAATPGEIVGTLNIRSHQAVVSIPYTAKNYSILYKDSTNLKYDASAQTIHENYASWIQRLDGAIRTRLAAAAN